MSNSSLPNSSTTHSVTTEPVTSQPVIPDPASLESQANESGESFKDLLSEFERGKSRKGEPAGKGREGTVVAVTIDSVMVDIGFKTEGLLPLTAFENAGKAVKPGDKLMVSIKGRDTEGYYDLSLGKIEE